jgi:hypothetical protein
MIVERKRPMSGFWEVSQSNSYRMPNTSTDDILIYGQSNTQRIVLGSLGNMSLSIGSNDVTTPYGFVSGTSTANTMSTNTLVISKGANVVAPMSINNVRNDLAIIVDQKAAAAWSGQASSGWNRRNLNTIYANVNSNVLAVTSDQVWIKQGTYEANWTVPFFAIPNSVEQSKLRNASTSTDIDLGVSGTTGTANFVSTGTSLFTVASASNAIEVHYYAFAGNSGLASLGSVGGGSVEVYTRLVLRRVA